MPEVYSVSEVALHENVSPRLVTQWLKEGRLKGEKVGKAWLVFELGHPRRKRRLKAAVARRVYWKLNLRCPDCGYMETVTVHRRKRRLIKSKEIIQINGEFYHIRRCGPLVEWDETI